MLDWLANNWVQVSTIVGLVVAWFVDRRKVKAEADNVQVKTLSNLDDFYTKWTARYRTEYDAVAKRLSEVEQRLTESNESRSELLLKLDEVEAALRKSQAEGEVLRMKVEKFERQSIRDKDLIADLTRRVELQKKRINQLEKTAKNGTNV